MEQPIRDRTAQRFLDLMMSDENRDPSARWRDDPFLPPDWRWRDAQRIVAGQQPRWSDSESSVLEAVRFLRASADRESLQASARRERYSDAIMARQIYEAGGMAKWLIEARILTRQDDTVIGKMLGVRPAVVRCYEALFFSVRKAIDACDWIDCQVVGGRAMLGFREDDLPRFWLWAGYHGGPLFLDYFIGCLLRATERGLPATLRSYLALDNGLPLRVSAFVALRALPPGIGEAHVLETVGLSGIASVFEPRNGTGKNLRDLQQRVVDLARRYLGGELPVRPAEQVTKRKKVAQGVRKPRRSKVGRHTQGVPAGLSGGGEGLQAAGLMLSCLRETFNSDPEF